MKKTALTIFLLILVSLVVIFSRYIFSEYFDFPYKNSSLPIDERVENLLSLMTLEEKIGQMALIERLAISDIKDLSLYGIGGVLSGGGSHPENNTPKEWLKIIKEYTDTSRGSRLGIPILYGVDAIHGHTNVSGATIFPHSIGLGATNDRELVKNIAKATAEEAGATGIFWIFSPTFDAPEDIRWGRTYEAYSSDKDISADLGSAFIEGLQGLDADKIVALATAKHYLGLGGMKWGTSSNKDYKIDQGTTNIDEKNLREFYLPPFKKALDTGVLSVMVGLNSSDGKKISANKYFLTDVLKNELGFKGFVVSDWYGVYEIPGDDYSATVTGINAGIDMLMLPYDYKIFIKNVSDAVSKGDISEERIDDAVRRILRAKFTVGLFDKTAKYKLGVIGSLEHRLLAREAVSKSIVLLQNKNNTLPLSPISSKENKIFIAGSVANNTGRQSGGWTIDWQGVDSNTVPGATSILQGIKETSNANIEHEENANFETESFDPDSVGIAVVGEKPYAEGVGDNENPSLSPEDLRTISKLQKISKKIIVIIVSGRPLILPPESKNWDAIIAAWLPGSEGAGIADVLFGKKPFTGKLPLAWPANLEQLPFSPTGVSANNTPPLFERGFGL